MRGSSSSNLSLLGEGDQPEAGGEGHAADGRQGAAFGFIKSVGQPSAESASRSTMLRMVPLSQVGEDYPVILSFPAVSRQCAIAPAAPMQISSCPP